MNKFILPLPYIAFIAFQTILALIVINILYKEHSKHYPPSGIYECNDAVDTCCDSDTGICIKKGSIK